MMVTNGKSDGLNFMLLMLIPGGGHFELHASLQLQEVAPSAAGLGTSHVVCGGGFFGVSGSTQGL